MKKRCLDFTNKEISSIKQEIDTYSHQDLIVITGDSTKHKDFFDILEYFKTKLFFKIMILSDCVVFNEQFFLDKMKNYPFVNFFALFEHPEIFKQTISGAINLMHENFKVFAFIPLSNGALDNLLETCESLAELNIKDVFLSMPHNKENIPFLNDIKGKIFPILENPNFMIHLENFPLCFFSEFQDHYSSFFDLGEKQYSEKCEECCKKSECQGILKSYLDNNSDSDIFPFTKTQNYSNEVDEIVAQFNEDSKIKICAGEVYDLFEYINTTNDMWNLVQNSAIPIPYFVKIVEILEKKGIVKVQDEKITFERDILPEYELQNYFDKRLKEKPNYTQLNVVGEDIFERCHHIIKTVGKNKRVVFLGDDDFVSLTLASSKIFDEITVLEIDPDIVERINQVAAENNLCVKAICHDLRKQLPNRLRNQYDAFYADTPYTENGFNLFISRGIQLLKNEEKKIGFASFSPVMAIINPVEMQVQKSINKMGLYVLHKKLPARNKIPDLLKEKYPNFEKLKVGLVNVEDDFLTRWYLAALGRKEYLFTFFTTKYSFPLITGEYSEEIYYEDDPLDYYLNK